MIPIGHQIILKVPSGEAGEHELTVINPDGDGRPGIRNLSKEFKEDLKPVVKVSPNEGNIRWRDHNYYRHQFPGRLSVTIDGRPATGVSWVGRGRSILHYAAGDRRGPVPLQVINVDTASNGYGR